MAKSYVKTRFSRKMSHSTKDHEENFAKIQTSYNAVIETGEKLVELKEETEEVLAYVASDVENIELQKAYLERLRDDITEQQANYEVQVVDVLNNLEEVFAEEMGTYEEETQQAMEMQRRLNSIKNDEGDLSGIKDIAKDAEADVKERNSYADSEKDRLQRQIEQANMMHRDMQRKMR